jgi:hypothetical protein
MTPIKLVDILACMVKFVLLLLLGTLSSVSLAEDLSFFCVEEESAATSLYLRDTNRPLISRREQNELFVIKLGSSLVVRRGGKNAAPFEILSRSENVVSAKREDRQRTLYYALRRLDDYGDAYSFGFIKTIIFDDYSSITTGSCTKS